MRPKIIAFDADDTLWHNEPYFDEAQDKFCELFGGYASKQELLRLILNHQITNLPLYGFGIKAFTLSMIESALELTNHSISGQNIEKVLQIGKELLQKPVELLPNVISVLEELKGTYKLIVATKGDLKDQQSKLHRSGLGHYFHHIEVMADKQEINYQKLLKRLEIQPSEFFMIGNSLKSDVLPVLGIGGYAVHIPFHTTWEHEKISHNVVHDNFTTLEKITEVLPILLK